jgi:hypothetical protein
MDFFGNFLSKWNFRGILCGGLLASIAEYLLNGSPREVKFHNPRPPNQWINAFIGLNVGTRNASSNIFGGRVYSIAPTTPANIMHQNIIKILTHFLFLTILNFLNSDDTRCPSIHDITLVI